MGSTPNSSIFRKKGEGSNPNMSIFGKKSGGFKSQCEHNLAKIQTQMLAFSAKIQILIDIFGQIMDFWYSVVWWLPLVTLGRY